jgi:PelA/Pel-15E family pectate lyase
VIARVRTRRGVLRAQARRTVSLRASALLVTMVLAACATSAQGTGATDASGVGTTQPPGALLAPSRIAALPTEQRASWQRYLDASQVAMAKDRALIAEELRAIGAPVMRRAPLASQSFNMDEPPSASWLSSDSARLLGMSMLSFQTPSGGWSKRVDFTKGPREKGQSFYSENERWQYIATIDNDATTSQIEYLVALDKVQPDPRWRDGAVRGVRYLLDAQMPNGCWPQVWPLQGSYHDAVTFNDDAVVRVATLFEKLAAGLAPWIAPALSSDLTGALNRTEGCIVRAQIASRGALGVWGQQHDPITLAPVGARSYELPSFATKESAAIMDWLMRRPAPSPAAVRAVHGAAAWLRGHALTGLVYDVDRGLRRDSTVTTPMWARLYTLDTERPLFANRDGVPRYDWNELTDRRQGYAWYGQWPASALRRYDRWARTHPAPKE